ncbi:MAG: hypothetical protein Q9211_006394, partial [Gyalolechia sp. 1 TL-2023]
MPQDDRRDDRANKLHYPAPEYGGKSRDPTSSAYPSAPEPKKTIHMDSTPQDRQKFAISNHRSSRDPAVHLSRPSSNGLQSDYNASHTYLDPTPTTPHLSATSSRAPSPDASKQEKVDTTEAGNPDGASGEGITSEIQSIIKQFDGGSQSQDDEVLSSRVECANSMLVNPVQHPPRKSSLEPVEGNMADGSSSPTSGQWKLPNSKTDPDIQSQSKAPSMGNFSSPQSARFTDQVSHTASPHSSVSGPRPQPPEPEPEPEVPFDFHRFLEQLRHRTADPVARFLRSFLLEFGKKQWMVHEQVKIIGDFLTFITGKMAQCDVWRGVSDAEFDNAKEGMEKLVMNRLYLQTFSPAIPPPAPPPDVKGRRKNIEKLLDSGRKGQHQEDIERDEVLGQKVRIYRWVQEEHLDIPPLGDNGRRFMLFAQQQLLKIKMYRAPRDKVVCVLNCCKVIFGFLSTSKSADTSADSFVPLLIYVVLRANPEHLVSNIQYILRFRNQEKLGGEAGYYLSSLMGAIQFIENLDRTSLTISDEDFEKK